MRATKDFDSLTPRAQSEIACMAAGLTGPWIVRDCGTGAVDRWPSRATAISRHGQRIKEYNHMKRRIDVRFPITRRTR